MTPTNQPDSQDNSTHIDHLPFDVEAGKQYIIDTKLINIDSQGPWKDCKLIEPECRAKGYCIGHTQRKNAPDSQAEDELRQKVEQKLLDTFPGFAKSTVDTITDILLSNVAAYAECLATERVNQARIDAIQLLIETFKSTGIEVTMDRILEFQAGQLLGQAELSATLTKKANNMNQPTQPDAQLREAITEIIVSIIQLPRGKTVTQDYYADEILALSQAAQQQLLTELKASLPTEDNGYESPKWSIPAPPEAYVGYAEGWDKAIDQVTEILEAKLKQLRDGEKK